MKIKTKASILFLVIGFFTIIITSIFYYGLNYRTIIDIKEQELTNYNNDKKYHLIESLASRLKIVQAIAQAPVIKETLKESNQKMSSFSDSEREQFLDNVEDEWAISRDKDVSEVVFLNNNASIYLNDTKKIDHQDIGEIFLTDKFGLAISSTGKLTTRTHAHKYWWIASYRDGINGDFFLDDRGYDDSVQGYVIGLVVPVIDDSEIIGILKVNFNIESVLEEIIQDVDLSGRETLISRSGGLIVKEKGTIPLSSNLSDQLMERISNEESGTYISDNDNQFFSFAKVDFDNFSFGGTDQSIDHSLGNANEDWYLISSFDKAEIYSIILGQIKIIIMTIIITVFIFIFFLTYFSKMFTQPIEELVSAVDKIGQGDLSIRVNNDSSDEIGNLTRGINEMVIHLTETLTSKSNLEDEIKKREFEEIRFTSLFNSMDEAVARHEIILDEKGKPVDYRFLTINPAFEKMLGMSASDVIGKTVLELLPETESVWIEKYGEVALTGESIKFENYSSELKKHFNVSAYSPKIGQFAVIFSDISEIKQMELYLERERNFLAITLKSIGDGIIATDTEGRITFINPISEKLTGWSLDDAVGQLLLDVFDIRHEETKVICDDPAQKVLETGQAVELANHTCLHSKDGNIYIIEDSASPIRNNKNEIVGVIIVFRDETEKKKLRDNINNNQKLESLGVLAGGIAHDFNNYLSGIFGYIELAMAETENLPSHSIKYLQEAINIFQNAKSLTHQLLTFAKGGAPKKTLANISIVFERSINFALSGSNIIPKLTIDDDLWPSVCDENRIGQCFDNLIINALQSMPKGGEIIFTAENCPLESKNYLKITIQDSGCGITQDKLQKIFDPFFTTKETGHGLGLATVFSIIKNHDGWIDVESKVDEGTTFTIYLPAVKKEIPIDQFQKKSNVIGSGTILVMDDQPFILELYKVMLEKLGYTVIAVDNGTSAIEQIKLSVKGDQKIRACFLDLTLPGGISGIDVAKEIKKTSPEIVNIASSGYSDNPVFSNPEKYGFNDSIEKPISNQDLIKILEENL